MPNYGQIITWGTQSAPQLFGGIRQRYRYGTELQEDFDEDEAGVFRAALLYGRKSPLEFEAKVTQASTNFLDLSAGAKIAVDGISTGAILCSEAVEKWSLFPGKKTASISAVHYPFTDDFEGPSASTSLNALTPDQSALGLLIPSGTLIAGTFGLTHAAGVVHELTLTQRWNIRERDLAPDGSIPGADAVGYQRRIELLLLATGEIPGVFEGLTIAGAPSHATGFINSKAEKMYETQRGMMYRVSAFWIPGID